MIMPLQLGSQRVHRKDYGLLGCSLGSSEVGIQTIMEKQRGGQLLNEDECEKGKCDEHVKYNWRDVCFEVEGYKLGQVLQEYPTSR